MNETTSDWTGQETRAQLPVLSFAGVARRYREGDGWLEILRGAEGRFGRGRRWRWSRRRAPASPPCCTSPACWSGRIPAR